jgi:hypothetical protein
VPFAASHRRCEGRRCLPAEILMTYLAHSTRHRTREKLTFHSNRRGKSRRTRIIAYGAVGGSFPAQGRSRESRRAQAT